MSPVKDKNSVKLDTYFIQKYPVTFFTDIKIKNPRYSLELFMLIKVFV